MCLEFGTDDEIFSGAFQVEYLDTYPSFKLTEDNLQINLMPLVTKSAVWRYEDEFRVIAEEHDKARSSGSLHTHDGFLSIPQTSLRAIILGCEMSAASRDSVRELIRWSERHIALKQATRVHNHYSLSIREIA
jgi:hypothetical protein